MLAVITLKYTETHNSQKIQGTHKHIIHTTTWCFCFQKRTESLLETEVFIFASNWFFALAQILILSTSLLRGKNYVSLLQDFKKTYTSGIFTEAYLVP